MPTINRMELPRPKDWQVFEDITWDALKLLWDSPTLQKNGRSGQKQNGVDIYGSDNLGRPIGVQCKKTIAELDTKIIENEIKKAGSFSGKLHTLYIATTTDNDVHLQKEIRKISEKRVGKDEFAVGIIFWEDIVSGLIKNPHVFKAHYPNIQTPKECNPQQHAIAAFELGFYGGNIAKFIDLILGEFGWMAQEDPDKVNVVLEIIEDHCQLLLPPQKLSLVKKHSRKLVDYLFSRSNRKIEAHNVKLLAERVTARIENCDSLLTNKQQQAFFIGKQLGFAYYDCSPGPPSDEFYNELASKINTLLENEGKKDLNKIIKKLKKEKGSEYSWENELRSFILHKLRWKIPN